MRSGIKLHVFMHVKRETNPSSNENKICVRREHLFFCYKEKADLLVFTSMPFPSFLLRGALHHRPWPTVYRPHTLTDFFKHKIRVIARESRNPEFSYSDA